jgi:ABC-type antimicrobial peptide transport system permease subunit
MPHAQQPFNIMSFMIRTSVGPMSLSGAVQKELWTLGRLMNVYQVEPLAQRLPESYWEMRFTMMILGLFAAVALILGAAGVYGVISSVVSQRTREIGVRMALGADRGKILALVLRQGLALAGLGVAIGAAGSLAVNRLLGSMLFGVEPNDPLTLAAVATILLAVAGSACAIPAWRAARTQPVAALRYE